MTATAIVRIASRDRSVATMAVPDIVSHPLTARGVIPSLVPGSPAEAPADLGKIVLQAGAVLTGSVEDPEGRPLAGALVRVGRTDELEDWLSGLLGGRAA